MSEIVAIAAEAAVAGQRGVSARREMAGPIASAGGVKETNRWHHSIAQEVI